MKTNIKACLFGGALLGAGLCSSASAGEVTWTFGAGQAKNLTHTESDAFAGDGWAADAGYGTHSIANTFGLDMVANGAPTGYAYASAFGHFTVTTDTTLLVDWDIGIGHAYLAGGGFFFQAVSGDSGSMEITLIQGVTYIADVSLTEFGGAPSFFSMNTITVVPLPPAALGGLAMLAGLGAYRRVRR